MSYGDYDPRNPFPHDGENGINCTGYGCDCDEKNYGSYRPKKSSGGDNGKAIKIFIGFIIANIIGAAFNELLGVIIIIGLVLYALA